MKDHVRVPGDAKVIRAQPMAAQAQAGNVRMKLAHWNNDYIDEMTSFPEFAYDDQVDASSGAFNKLRSMTDFVDGHCVRTVVGAKSVSGEKYGVEYEKSRRSMRPSKSRGDSPR
jgi:hypothetical protein